MTLLLVRLFFFFLSGVVGFQIGSIFSLPFLGVAWGCAGACVVIFFEAMFKQASSLRGLTSMVFGLLLGFFMAKLIADILTLIPLGEVYQSVARVVLTLVFSYLGAIMALRGKDEFNIIIPYVRFRRTDTKEGVVVLDTSAIIDGRIADIYKSHFLAGRLVVPRFVLVELQKLADSEDDLKRERGRRGMEILRAMQDDAKVDIHVHEDDLMGPEGVDAKLIKLARTIDGRICTTDFNLSRIATIQGIDVLNINSLVNSVKPVIYVGEELMITPVKEGKENHQAVGYLEDGTMVVISDARAYIGKSVQVVVNSVLQTQAGRMIFAKIHTVVNHHE